MKTSESMTIREHVQVIGRLGANPGVKNLKNGKKVARFSVCVYDGASESKSARKWFPVVAWDLMANMCEALLLKGTQVTVDGRLVKRCYTNKKGKEQFLTEIVAREVMIIPDKKAA
jgi:single-strand DNA-binding protein